MIDPLISQLRLAALIVAFAGAGLIANAGARGPASVSGFALFCLGMAALDALYRRRLGFRQAALFLGSMAAGLGLWAVVATGFSGLLDLPVSRAVEAVLIAAAGCAVGSVTAALLSVSRRGPRRWVGAIGRRLRGAVARLGGRGRDLPPAERRWRPTGPVREG